MSVFFVALMPFGFLLEFFIAVCEEMELKPKRLLRGCLEVLSRKGKIAMQLRQP